MGPCGEVTRAGFEDLACQQCRAPVAVAVAALAGQQVRCKMALVFLVVLASTLIAWAVGTMTRSTSRRRACSRTSFITGSAPTAPVPITSRRHRQGISSAADSGV